MTNLYPWNTTEDISSQSESRYETPGGAQNKVDTAFNKFKNEVELPIKNGAIVERHIRSENITERTLAQKAVTRSKIATGAVGAQELDPTLLQNYGDIAVQAKFVAIGKELEESINFQSERVLEMPETYLRIPSPLGSDLTTHPSVIDFEAQYGISAWQGYRFWMAHTPYPGVENENPCIACSVDGKTWITPVGVTNPLVPWPGGDGYNSDTEVIYLPDVNKLRMYYRQYGVNANTQIFYIESSNGITWGSPVLTLDTPSATLSPSIVRVGANDYRMWYVNSETEMAYRTSSNGVTWSVETVFNHPWTTWKAWHIGVAVGPDEKFHMLASTYPTENDNGVQYRPIIHAYSSDGLNWIPNETPLLIPSGWANGYLYRPSFHVVYAPTSKRPYVRVWFGASEALGYWHIGFTEGWVITHSTATLSTNSRVRKNISEAFAGMFAKIRVGYAAIVNLIAQRIIIKNEFGPPTLLFEDKRLDAPDNQARIEWSVPDDVDNNTRIRLFSRKGSSALGVKAQYAPYGNWMRFETLTEIINANKLTTLGKSFSIIAQGADGIAKVLMTWDASANAWTFNNVALQQLSDVRSNRLIAYNEGVRVYHQDSTTVFYALVTDASGNLNIRHSTQSTNHHKFRSDGNLQGNETGYMDAKFLNLASQSAQPSILTSSRTGIYLANGTTHDPCNAGTGKPYLVYYDGTYTKLG